MIIPDFTKIKTNQWTEAYFMKNFYDFHKWLSELYPFDISFKEKIYWYINKVSKLPVCKECGGPVKFLSVKKGYTTFCSSKCKAINIDEKEKTKQTLLDKYGVEHNFLIPDVHEKRKNTWINKYNTENPAQNNTVKDKIQKTCIKRYGAITPLLNDDKKAKAKKTMLDKYNVEHALQNDLIKEKAKQTCIKRFGVESAIQSDVIKNKIKANNNEKYGVDWCLQDETIREKAKKTCKKRFGVEFPTQSPEVKEKIIKTKISRYGFSNYTNREKASETCKEKYGVEWPCMRPEAKNFKNDSKPNNEFEKLLKENNIAYEREFKIENRSFDFKIGNYLIELNPYATHNSTWGIYGSPLDKNYHLNKSNLAAKYNFKCIHIWDWDDKNKIINFFRQKNKIYARNCIIKEINKTDCNNFLNAHHLQNTCKGQTIRLGLFYNDELVQVMTFGRPRYNQNFEYEILRLCSNSLVIGGAEKLFKYFVNKFNPRSIISYCDTSKFTGDVYLKLGFILKSKNSVSCHWYNGKTHITDNMLRKLGFDKIFNTKFEKGANNADLMRRHKFVEIYDTGQSTYIWHTTKEET